MSGFRFLNPPPEPEPWRYCRDCAMVTFRCWRHSSWVTIIPATTVVSETTIHSTDPRTGSRIDTVEHIPITYARELFDQNKRAKMSKRSDGVFVFVIGTAIGYERIEVEIE